MQNIEYEWILMGQDHNPNDFFIKKILKIVETDYMSSNLWHTHILDYYIWATGSSKICESLAKR